MLYNNNFFYLLNSIHIHKSKKNLYIDVLLTKRTLMYTKIIYKLNYIFRYEIIVVNNIKKIRLYFNFNNNNHIGKDFKIISKPSHRFFISLNSLNLLFKKTKSSVYLLSTSYGIFDHKEAIKNKTGGLMLAFFIL